MNAPRKTFLKRSIKCSNLEKLAFSLLGVIMQVQMYYLRELFKKRKTMAQVFSILLIKTSSLREGKITTKIQEM